MKKSEVEEYLMQKVEVTLADGTQLLGILHRGRDRFARKHLEFEHIQIKEKYYLSAGNLPSKRTFRPGDIRCINECEWWNYTEK